ncbi:MAG: hypothetical protein IT204_02160 [Fimbriimonadaceae bacterium]|nr:hypothetical protein [Fimbriimonadaceae bacterium]
MGRAQGEHWREAVQEVCEARLASTLRWARLKGRSLSRTQLLGYLPPFLPVHQAYDADVWEEFAGIAEGAGVGLPELLIGNGYTDVRDVVVEAFPTTEGCTTFTALPPATADGRLYVGQTWDMDSSMLPYVYLCTRRPDRGPATVGVTTCGCLSLMGLNEAGIAVGNSNITPRDARVGVIYLALIHRALAQRTLDNAVLSITAAERASGHHYYLADAQRAVHLETTATRCDELDRDGACHAQSNDYRSPHFGELPVPPTPEGRSIERRCQLAAELAARSPLTVGGLQAALAAPGIPVSNALAATCASIIMDPAARQLWATHGAPAADAWQQVTL